jgi:hypothetical protein
MVRMRDSGCLHFYFLSRTEVALLRPLVGAFLPRRRCGMVVFPSARRGIVGGISTRNRMLVPDFADA